MLMIGWWLTYHTVDSVVRGIPFLALFGISMIGRLGFIDGNSGVQHCTTRLLAPWAERTDT